MGYQIPLHRKAILSSKRECNNGIPFKLKHDALGWNSANLEKIKSIFARFEFELSQGKDVAIDWEATGLNHYSVDYLTLGFSLSVIVGDQNPKIISRKEELPKGYSIYFDTRFPNVSVGAIPELKEMLINFLQKWSNQLWAHNAAYEHYVHLRFLGIRVELQDTMALLVAGRSLEKSLKYGAKRLLGAHDWDANNKVLRKNIIALHNSIPKTLQPFLQLVRKRYVKDWNKGVERGIYDYFQGFYHYAVKAVFSDNEIPENIPTTLKEYRKLPNCFNKLRDKEVVPTLLLLSENVNKESKERDTSLLAFSLNHMLMQPPSKLLVEQFGMSQNELLISLLYYQNDWGAAGGIGADSSKISLGLMGTYCNWDTFYTLMLKRWVQRFPEAYTSRRVFQQQVLLAGIFGAMKIRVDYDKNDELLSHYFQSATDDLANLIQTYLVENLNLPTTHLKILKDIQAGCEFPLHYRYKEDTKKVSKRWRDTEDIPIIQAAIDERKSWLNLSRISNVRAVAERSDGKVQLEIEYTKLEDKKVDITNERSRLDHLKTYYNPNSTLQDSVQTFWSSYLNPEIRAANILYGMYNEFRSSSVLLEATGELPWKIPKFNQDLQKYELEEVFQPLLDSKSLLNTLKLQTELGESLRIWLQETPLLPRNKSIEIDWKDAIRKLGSAIRALRVISDEIESGVGYVKQFTQDLKAETMILQTDVHTCILGVDLEDKSTWNDKFKMIVGFRLHKKKMKAVTTYLHGKKTGRENYSIGFTPKPVNGVTAPPVIVAQYGEMTHKEVLAKGYEYFINSNFRACSAVTDRFSSGMHTIPRDSELRLLYTPRHKGWAFIHADYSQAELVCVAAMAQEENMLRGFIDGMDLHLSNACTIYNCTPEQVTANMRSSTKAITFAILFQAGAESVAEKLKIPLSEAQAMFDKFYAAFPKLKIFVEEQKAHLLKHGWVRSIYGSPINPDGNEAARLRKSVNYPIQNASTCMAGVSIYRLYNYCLEQEIPWIPLSFTHDSIDSEFHPAYLFHLLVAMRKKMMDEVYKFIGIPAKLDFELGTSQYAKSHFSVTGGKGTSSLPYLCGFKGRSGDVYEFLDLMKPYFNLNKTSEIFDETELAEVDVYDKENAPYSSELGKVFETVEMELEIVALKEEYRPDISSLLLKQGGGEINLREYPLPLTGK